MLFNYHEVEFKTLDGLTLRGSLYLAKTVQPGPGIVMAPDFNCTKDMFLSEIATSFQEAGITVLIYDPRSIGLSDGEPRNDIDPSHCVSDYSDALTYLASCVEVDDSQLVIWGFSFSASVALCAATLDPRVMCVIAVCPLVDLSCSKIRPVLRVGMEDRVRQVEKGRSPVYIPLWNEKDENPAGFQVGPPRDEIRLLHNFKKTTPPMFKSKTTAQSYYRLAMWKPHELWKSMYSTAVLWIVGENDKPSPAARQISVFETLRAPKDFHVVKGKEHMEILGGRDLSEIVKVQKDFIEHTAADRPYVEPQTYI